MNFTFYCHFIIYYYRIHNSNILFENYFIIICSVKRVCYIKFINTEIKKFVSESTARRTMMRRTSHNRVTSTAPDPVTRSATRDVTQSTRKLGINVTILGADCMCSDCPVIASTDIVTHCMCSDCPVIASTNIYSIYRLHVQ